MFRNGNVSKNVLLSLVVLIANSAYGMGPRKRKSRNENPAQAAAAASSASSAAAGATTKRKRSNPSSAAAAAQEQSSSYGSVAAPFQAVAVLIGSRVASREATECAEELFSSVQRAVIAANTGASDLTNFYNQNEVRKKFHQAQRTEDAVPKAIQLALRSGNPDIIKCLYNVNPDSSAHQAIFACYQRFAAARGYYRTISLLSQSGIPAYASNLWVAAERGKTEAAKLLISQGAANKRGPNGCTIMHHAIRQPAVLQFLIDLGVSVHQKSTDGLEPLHVAALFGQNEAAQILLDHGVPVDVKTSVQSTPLMGAALKGQTHLVRLFLERGANIAARNKDDLTALSLAVGFTNNETNTTIQERNSIARLLIHRGALALETKAGVDHILTRAKEKRMDPALIEELKKVDFDS